MPSDADSSGVSLRRRVIALSGVVLAIIGAAAIVFMLPESYRVLLIGKTVNHCPGSEFSCPSQQPGLLLFLMIPVILYEAATEESDAE